MQLFLGLKNMIVNKLIPFTMVLKIAEYYDEKFNKHVSN